MQISSYWYHTSALVKLQPNIKTNKLESILSGPETEYEYGPPTIDCIDDERVSLVCVIVWRLTDSGASLCRQVGNSLHDFSLQWRHNDRDDVSNQQRLDCLRNRMFRGRHQSSALQTFVRGIHRWPVNSPHKGPVTSSCIGYLSYSAWSC